MNFAEIADWIFDNLQTLFFPEEMVSLDMKLSKVELISLLYIDRKGEIIMSGLADYLNVSMSTATGIVNRLNRQGLVQRGRSDADRRIVSLSLTEEGRSITERVSGMVDEYLGRAARALTEEEQHELSRLLMKILGALRKDEGAEVPERVAVRDRVTRIRID